MISKYVAPDKLMASAGAIEKKNLKIACVAFGEIGHFNPMTNVATALQERGHEVYIITNGHDQIREKSKDHTEKLGINMIYTSCSLTSADLFRKPNGCEDPGDTYMYKWHPFVFDEIKKLGPDVIVSDYLSCCGTLVGEELGIPVVISAPASIGFMEEMGFDIPNMRNASLCCGMVCFKHTFKRCCIGLMIKMGRPYVAKYWRKRYDHTWMFHSFFGLEKATCLPPNFKMIGPIAKEPNFLMKQLQEKDMKLYNWLEDALSKKEDVVFITLGSIAKWQQWSINAVYRGLKNIGCRVVWSLKEEWYFMLDENPKDNPKFWMGSWLPQIEVINHPAVKGGLTHCGWGGILEFIGAGVPIVTFPHFYDQNSNSELITDQKAGVELHNKRKLNVFDLDAMLTYKDPEFDHTKVESCFNKILKDPIYAQNMQRLQTLSRLTGGRKQVVKTVEQMVFTGNNHLLDGSLKKRMLHGQSWCKSTLFFIILICMFASFLYFGNEYYYPEKKA